MHNESGEKLASPVEVTSDQVNDRPSGPTVSGSANNLPAEVMRLSDLLRATSRWLCQNSTEAAKAALLGLTFGYVSNVVMMAVVYDGYRKTAGGFATGQNSLIDGSLLWMILSTVIFTLYGYRKSVGRERFYKALQDFPSAVDKLFGADGANARSHLLWGAGVTFVGSHFVSPALGLTVGMAMAASATSLIGRIVAGILFRAWSEVMNRVNPGKKNPLDTPLAMTICLMGSCAAFILAFLVKDFGVKIILALACFALALLRGKAKGQGSGLMCLGAFLFLGLLREVFGPMAASADDGGYWENGGLIPWIMSGGIMNVLVWSIPGGAASGFGAVVGTGLGNVLGANPGQEEEATPQTAAEGSSPSDSEKQAAAEQIQSDMDYHRKEMEAWKAKLGSTTDPKARDEMTRRVLYHDHMFSDCKDKLAGLSGDGIVHHSRTALDAFDQQMMSEQSRQMAEDYRQKLDDIKNQAIIQSAVNQARMEKFDELIAQARNFSSAERQRLEELVNRVARKDKFGVPHGDLGLIESYLNNQQKLGKGYGWFDGAYDTTTGGLKGTGSGVLNVVTLGFSDVIGKNAGTGKLSDKIMEHGVNLVTFGGYEGYKKGGVWGIPTGIGKTLLPIDEAGVVFGIGHGATWDQRIGAAGAGMLKLITLGKVTGKYLSSRPITQAEINSTKYGYHFTTPENAASIMQSGFETRLPGTKSGISGAISKGARGFKDLFVENEPAKAGYMWGTSKPGAGRVGDINYKQPPVVIDLSKVNPKDLMVRPSDGAIVFVGDKIPPSALSRPANWSQVPLSPTPLTGNPLANLPRAVPYTAGSVPADESFKEIYKEELR